MYFFFFFFSLLSIISVGMVLLWKVVSVKTRKVRDKKVAFECGFDPFVKCNIPFTLRFYIVGLLFLIVDVELVLFLPVIFSDSMFVSGVSWFSKLMLVVFLGVLVVGIFHEEGEGSLEWKYNTHLNKVRGKTFWGPGKSYFKAHFVGMWESRGL